jgi:pyruvate ferredoxin oxidoreductase beta subunit
MAVLEQWRGVKAIPEEEYFVSGHRTCQGCESALIMRYIAKAAGPRSIVMGSTGCMYVANTSYYTTPWAIPWMHTQLGAAGSAALGAAAGLQSQMRKGKMKQEPINVIAFCGDGGGGDMGLSAISATLTHREYNCLIVLYDNESYANTDIQLSSLTPWGAITTFSPAGTVKRIMHSRWKKNVPGLLAAGHCNVSRFVGTACASYGLDFMNKVRKALTLGGPTFLQTLDPCPKGWHYDPERSHELGILAVECGIMPLWEVVDGKLSYNGPTKNIVLGKQKRRPVREWLEKQGRFAHFTQEDYDYFQKKVDEMWEQWILPGVVAFDMSTADKTAVLR